jgi:hypothetical protein
MAHVFFFNAVGGDCRNELLQRHWRALENSCSQMARVILLPKKALLREIGDGLPTAGQCLEIAKRFRVSPAVFIYRLHVHDVYEICPAADGLIACVFMQGSHPRVIARHAFGSLGVSRWPRSDWRPEGLPLESLCLLADVRDMLNCGKQVVFEANVFWRREQVIPSTVEIQWYDASTAILSVRLDGHIQKTGNGRPRGDS